MVYKVHSTGVIRVGGEEVNSHKDNKEGTDGESGELCIPTSVIS